MQISNIHESIINMKSIATRFFRNVFEAVQNTRSTCFIGSKTTALRLVVLNLMTLRKIQHLIRDPFSYSQLMSHLITTQIPVNPDCV